MSTGNKLIQEMIETHKPADSPNAWQTNAKRLAEHAVRNLLNRNDGMGAYGSSGPFTYKTDGEISEARTQAIQLRLVSHFEGRKIGGIHPNSVPNTAGIWFARFGCIDLDLKPDHPYKAARQQRNHEFALLIQQRLDEYGIPSIVEDSNGRGGFHIWFRLSDRIEAAPLYAFLQSLVADAEANGFEKHFQRVDENDNPLFLPNGKPNYGNDLPETFPKQAAPTGDGFGNFIRLPGKHHTYEHWSRIWGDGEWLSIEDSVEAWLSLPAADVALIPELPTERPEVAPVAPARSTTQVSARDHESIGDLAERTIESESWFSILQAAGWKLHSENGSESKWTRPGKNGGVSAKLNFNGNNLLTVFTSSVAGLNNNGELSETFGKWRFYCWSNGFENRQVEAAKAYLPQSVVDDHDRKSREAFKASKNALSVDESGLKHGANGAIVDKLQKRKKICDEFKPFPISDLPPVLASFCREVSRAVGCDESFPAMVALSACSSAIGTTRQLCIKYGWFVPPIVWTLLVGESGTQKSPPFRMAMAPLKEKQQRDADAFMSESAQYQSDLKTWKRENKQWERTQEGAEPEEPERPVRSRCLVQDATIEALAPVLNENPRGVLLARDELSGWLAGFDKYSGKASSSSEVPKWLEIYNAESITIDRKTGDERFLFVRRPFVSICGGIQPGILSRCLTDEHKDSGLQSRLLMTFPPRQAKEWRDDELSPETQAKYGECIQSLFDLKHDDSSGELRPATLSLSPEARELYKQYVNLTGKEQAAMHGHLASQWSKLEEIPARLAIILHCVRQVTAGVADHWEIDEQTMHAAINLGEWFKGETLRINRVLTLPEAEREAQQLVKWIQTQGGKITARDLSRLRRDITTSEEAEEKLIQLSEMGFGEWRGIHKSREFFLFDQDLSTIAT
jgi:hypothetical protein